MYLSVGWNQRRNVCAKLPMTVIYHFLSEVEILETYWIIY